MSLQNIMLDLETYSTEPNAVILTIGALKFDPRDPKLEKLEKLDTFYRRIDIKSCVDVGLVISQQTKDWWSRQTQRAQREALYHPDKVELKVALTEFKEWLGGDNLKIWAHGDDFDTVILGQAYKKCKMVVPWKFYNTRDTRTVFDIANYFYNSRSNNNQHIAIDDCWNQTKAIKESFAKLLD